MPKVNFYYGSPEAYAGLDSYDSNGLYFIEAADATEGVLYKGSVRYTPEQAVQFVSSVPGSPAENTLYVVNDGESVSLVIRGADGTAEEISSSTLQPGAITSLNVFDESLITTSAELTSGELPASDDSIPTSGAVKSAIETAIQSVTSTSLGLDSAIIDVSADRSEDNSGTILTFTPKSGAAKTVTIADLFLTSASYDSSSHILTLVVQGGDSVEVNLEELIPTTSTFSTVEVGTGNGFEVNLGAGVGLGGFAAGDEITEDMTLAEFAKKLLIKQVPPTYTQPTISISRSGGTANGNVEIGTNVNVSLSATYTQNDAGALTSIQFKKGSENVGEPSSTSPATYTESINSFDTSVSYTAVASYARGPVKNDNLGQPYPTGQIAAGSKTSSAISFTPYRKGFYGAVSTKDATIDSAFVRSLASSTTSAPANGNTWTIQIPIGTLRVAFAYPATLRDVTKVTDAATQYDVKTAFTLSTVSVEGANGYTGTNYKVYVTDFANPTTDANTYTVEI